MFLMELENSERQIQRNGNQPIVQPRNNVAATQNRNPTANNVVKNAPQKAPQKATQTAPQKAPQNVSQNI